MSFDHDYGINPITQEWVPYIQWLRKDPLNIVIIFRVTGYLYNMKELFDFIFNNDKTYVKCDAEFDPTEYVNFSDYGIPNLTIELLHFFKVIYGIEPSPEGFLALSIYYNNVAFFDGLKTRPTKTFDITEIGKIKIYPLGELAHLDDEEEQEYACSRANQITLGEINPIRLLLSQGGNRVKKMSLLRSRKIKKMHKKKRTAKQKQIRISMRKKYKK